MEADYQQALFTQTSPGQVLIILITPQEGETFYTPKNPSRTLNMQFEAPVIPQMWQQPHHIVQLRSRQPLELHSLAPTPCSHPVATMLVRPLQCMGRPGPVMERTAVKPRVGNLKVGSHLRDKWMIMLHLQVLRNMYLNLQVGPQANPNPVERPILSKDVHPTEMSLMAHINICNGRPRIILPSRKEICLICQPIWSFKNRTVSSHKLTTYSQKRRLILLPNGNFQFL